MADFKATKTRIAGGLALAFVLVFVVYVAYETWLKPAPEPVSAPVETVAEQSETPDCTDVSGLAENHALLGLKDGCVEIAFRPDLAPQHVARIKTLAAENFYDGIVFHRVIEGFMAQTGDPTGTGMGGSDLPDLPAEFSDVHFGRGILGMARTSDPNSANSQFFIMFTDYPSLDGQYTVFGEVVSGMEYVDAIKQGDAARNGLVSNPDQIITLRAK